MMMEWFCSPFKERGEREEVHKKNIAPHLFMFAFMSETYSTDTDTEAEV